MFKIDPSDLANGDLGVKALGDCYLYSTHIYDIPISPPQKIIRSTKIKRACFEPSVVEQGTTDTPVKRIAGIQASELYTYDIPTSQSLGTQSFGNETLNSVSYSHHSPSGQLMAVSGSKGSIHVLDSRAMSQQQESNSSILWTVNDAHIGEVTDVAFNTFIPYWLASAGEDGVVKMWDIRYLRGFAARIDAHYGRISSVLLARLSFKHV